MKKHDIDEILELLVIVPVLSTATVLVVIGVMGAILTGVPTIPGKVVASGLFLAWVTVAIVWVVRVW